MKDLYPYIGKTVTVTKEMCDFNGHMNVNFIKEVLSIIEDRNIYVMPTSPQIVSFIRKNKQYKHLLPIGVRI